MHARRLIKDVVSAVFIMPASVADSSFVCRNHEERKEEKYSDFFLLNVSSNNRKFIARITVTVRTHTFSDEINTREFVFGKFLFTVHDFRLKMLDLPTILGEVTNFKRRKTCEREVNVQSFNYSF